MEIFFYSDHTLHAKSLIPLVIKFAREGHKVLIKKNNFNFRKYSPRIYCRKPTRNTLVNPSSFDYVAKIIDYSKELNEVRSGLSFVFMPSLRKVDVIIGTTKSIPKLKVLCKENKIYAYAIGYQHMPFLVSIFDQRDWGFPSNDESLYEVFFGDNNFSKIHRFCEILRGNGICILGFPYLDKAQDYLNSLSVASDKGRKRYVLIFHPGGYRNVITSEGEPKKACRAKQAKFIKDICLPILDIGLIPVIKTHPLYAIYHSIEDLRYIIKELSQDDPRYNEVVVTDDGYWRWAFYSKFIITFGSSSIYELFSRGFKNVCIVNWLGKERSSKFSFLTDITINSYEDFLEMVKNNSFPEIDIDSTNNIFEAYHSIHKEKSTEKIYKVILGETYEKKS